MKTRILITGATGNIGRYVIQELLQRNIYTIRVLALGTAEERKWLSSYQENIEIVWGDIRNIEVVKKAVQDTTAVIHLAAIIPPLADEQPQLAEAVNVGGMKNILKAVEITNSSPRFLFCSSVSIYGDRVSNPCIKVGDPIQPSVGDHYATTKVEAEELLHKSSLSWTIFRLSAISNPRYEFGPLVFHMPLETSIEWCMAQDVAFCLVEALTLDENTIGQRIYNLGGGLTCRVIFRDYLSHALRLHGLSPKVIEEDLFAKQNFHCGYYVDGDELAALIPFQRSSMQNIYNEMSSHIPFWQKFLNHFIPSFLVKRHFRQMSEPYRVLNGDLQDNKTLKTRFFAHSA